MKIDLVKFSQMALDAAYGGGEVNWSGIRRGREENRKEKKNREVTSSIWRLKIIYIEIGQYNELKSFFFFKNNSES